MVPSALVKRPCAGVSKDVSIRQGLSDKLARVYGFCLGAELRD